MRLAVELLNAGIEDVIPEYLVPPTPAAERSSDGSKHKRDCIDLLVLYEGTYTAVEIKYKTISNKRDGYRYKNQGAQNNGKFDFVSDIERCERFVSEENTGPGKRPITDGIAILLTNDRTYWRKARSNSHVKVFDLDEGRRIRSELDAGWKDRESIRLKGEYEIRWFPKETSGSEPFFRYCMVEVPPNRDSE